MPDHHRSHETTDAEAIFFVILLVVVGILMMIEPSRVFLVELAAAFLHVIVVMFLAVGSWIDHLL